MERKIFLKIKEHFFKYLMEAIFSILYRRNLHSIIPAWENTFSELLKALYNLNNLQFVRYTKT